jgi:hypothetical protein
MAKFLRLSGGVPRSFFESGAGAVPIYDETLKVVASSPSSGETTPVLAGNPITLPNSGTYDGIELQVFLNGNYLEDVIDYTLTSSTQITLTFDLEVGDKIRFRIDRPAEP